MKGKFSADGLGIHLQETTTTKKSPFFPSLGVQPAAEAVESRDVLLPLGASSPLLVLNTGEEVGCHPQVQAIPQTPPAQVCLLQILCLGLKVPDAWIQL